MIVRVLSLVTTLGLIAAVVFRANYCARVARAELAKSAAAERAATAAPTAADSAQGQDPAQAQVPPAASSDIWRAPAHIQARRQATPPSVVERVMAERYLAETAERNQDARTKDTAADRHTEDR